MFVSNSKSGVPLKVEATTLTDALSEKWDQYTRTHRHATVYHLSAWRKVIQGAYNHKTHYLMAVNTDLDKVIGILPLVHIRHRFLGNTLISMPFFDTGGLLADTTEAAAVLIDAALKKARQLGVSDLELRHTWNTQLRVDSHPGLVLHSRIHKVRMKLELPDSSETLLRSFKAKLRSQIKIPIQQGLTNRIGGIELVDDFYNVFAINMRDLGSPVHSRTVISKTMEHLSENARIVMVYKERTPVAGSVVVGFRNTLANPWASALRQYKKSSPNMLLYWTMLSFAADNGYRFFDFGRSTPGEGTYKFKQQWGAQPQALHWQNLLRDSGTQGQMMHARRQWAETIWARLPVRVTTLIGPMIRKYIPL